MKYSMMKQVGLAFLLAFPHSLVGKESACSAGDLGLILGEGNGNPLQYPCLGNLMDRGAWWAAVHELGMTELQRIGHG